MHRLKEPGYRESIARHGIIVVEGFNDVISLDNLGIPAVAIMSNRITERQGNSGPFIDALDKKGIPAFCPRARDCLGANSGRELAGGRTIRRRRRAEQTRWQGGHRHGSAGHVKKLDAVSNFLAGDVMALDQDAHVAGAQTEFRQVHGENHVLVQVNIHGITPDTL